MIDFLFQAATAARVSFWPNPFAWFIWAFFGNADDGLYGIPELREKYGKADTGWRTIVWWWARNPFHNLCFYTLATAPQEASWALWPAPGERLKFQRYPFLVSFRRFGMEGYLGWRPKSLPDGKVKGVFGVAFRRE